MAGRSLPRFSRAALVTAPAPLALTGASPRPLVALSALSLVLGVALLALPRRRP